MRRKLFELGIVRRMEAAVRDEEDFVAPGGIGKFADVGQEFLGSGDVELAARQHEISLDVYFPKNVVTRSHSMLRSFRPSIRQPVRS